MGRCTSSAGYQPAGARATSPRRQVAGAPAAKLAAVLLRRRDGGISDRQRVVILQECGDADVLPRGIDVESDALVDGPVSDAHELADDRILGCHAAVVLPGGNPGADVILEKGEENVRSWRRIGVHPGCDVISV